MYSNVKQLYVYIHPLGLEPPSWLSWFQSSRSSQNTQLSSLCYTAAANPLFYIYCMVVYVCVFPPNYIVLWDSKTPHRPVGERVSCCLDTSPPSWLSPLDGSPSLTHLSLFLSFIFCPTCFWRQWAAFLGPGCPLPAFRSCFMEVAQHSNDLLMHLWGRRWSPHPIPPPS